MARLALIILVLASIPILMLVADMLIISKLHENNRLKKWWRKHLIAEID